MRTVGVVAVLSSASSSPVPAARPDKKPFWRTGALLILFTLFGGNPVAAYANGAVSYVVSLAGINFATVNADLDTRGGTFELGLDANVSGVGSLVASGTAQATATGSTKSNGLTARSFDLETRANGETFTVDVDYAGGNAEAFRIDPPVTNNIDRVAVERKHMRGVTDPMASFIIKADALTPGICDRTLEVFTGMERFNIEMSFAAEQTATSPRTGYQGPVVLCTLKYVPISGHFTTSEVTSYLANSDRILIWYAPLNDSGYMIPYRVLMGTAAGDLSMVLTQMR